MFPEFLPAGVQNLTEPTSIAMARQMQQAQIKTELSDRSVLTPYVRQGQGKPAFLLLHGFDSSLLEFRRLVPELVKYGETWAIDLLGFGFSDRTCVPNLNPPAIKHHLFCFWQQMIREPVVLVGASMGGAVAIDFVLTYPEAASQLVLLDSAGLAAGPALERLMFPPLDRWATNFLKNPGVRRRISLQAYRDPQFVTPDAETCAALHLSCAQWSEALIAFTKSGGYNFLAEQVGQITLPTLILWGRQDRILGIKDATRFNTKITGSKLVWLEECGHVPHLEKPQETGALIGKWLKN